MQHEKLMELQPHFTNQKSFYGKAHVKIEDIEDATYYTLFSYNTFIIELKEFEDIDGLGEIKIINAITDNPNHLTQTTLRHLNDFIQHHGMKKQSKAEWLEDLDRIRYTN